MQAKGCSYGGGYLSTHSKSRAKGLATVLPFAMVPRCAGEGHVNRAGVWQVLVDAAKWCKRFRVALGAAKGFYCSTPCPSWVRRLQQAEVYTIYDAAKMVVDKKIIKVLLGTNSSNDGR